MTIIRNILAFIGLITIVALSVIAIKIGPVLSELDPKFMDVYQNFASRLLAAKDPVIAMVKSVPVKEDLTPEDVIASLKSLAVSRNFLFVGETPFYKQVEAITGKPYRYASFLSFCDAQVGKMMMDYQDAYTGFMPCRIAVVKDMKGRLWLHSMNLGLMIHGGKALPAKLKQEALRVWENIQWMMEGAAQGEF